MWKNSQELCNYVLEQIYSTLDNGETELSITLKERCKDELHEISEIGQKLKIGEITSIIKKEFKDYHVKSCIGIKGNISITICYSNYPYDMLYPLVWTLNFMKKDEYDVSKLYILTTYRSVKIDNNVTRLYTEYYIGKKSEEGYEEIFSGVQFHVKESNLPEELNKVYVLEAVPLSTRYRKSGMIDRSALFYFITDMNSQQRTTADFKF